MTFSQGRYFDSIDIGEACAHEYAAFHLGITKDTPLRAAIGNPCDLRNRPINLALSILTLRFDPIRDEASFPLHRRDPVKVAHAGGLSTVVPVGVFQPSSDKVAHRKDDFSLWRFMIREYAEELLNEPEIHADEQPIDYTEWPLATGIYQAIQLGHVQAHCLGIGVDPLTLATDALIAVIIEAPTYDYWFGDNVTLTNDEGELMISSSPGQPINNQFLFTASTIQEFSRSPNMQPASAALLRAAWEKRDVLLAPFQSARPAQG